MMEYTTIEAYASAQITERRSRFIGHVQPVTTQEEAQDFIDAQKAKYWDASHNVYAYVLREGQTRRYSDDGEPSGTAGLPVLETLQREGLCDLAAVVTRYFGGVLLGTGGLTRAYAQSAKAALSAARKIVMSPCTELELECGYDFYGKLSYFLPRFHAKTVFSDFGAVVCLRILIKDADKEAFLKELTQQSAARILPREISRRMDHLDI